ncbi:MAG: 16S rRNA (adenine(1518)-N(6)/adenine(1519)-N(6))-dimethyltransferase RsmA [Acidobacteriota bacterium]
MRQRHPSDRPSSPGRPRKPRPDRPILKKRFGQHHLRSGASCRPLLDFLKPRGVRVVEIGPGGGVLTRELVDAGASVWAVEVDIDWAFHLKRNQPDLAVLHLDALHFPWRSVPPGTFITGNLPFNVGTKLIDHTLEAATLEPARIPKLGYMVQKEVGERLVADVGDAAYGAFSVLARARADVSYLGTVPARAFRPPPKVDAAFVGLRAKPPICGPSRLDAYRRLVFAAFSKRRKMLRGVLGGAYGKAIIDRALDRAEIDPTRRAENLSAADFLRLLDAMPEVADKPNIR